jgi:hypothetical protein
LAVEDPAPEDGNDAERRRPGEEKQHLGERPPWKTLVEHERQDEADNSGDADADEGVDCCLSQDRGQIGIFGKLAKIRQRPE